MNTNQFNTLIQRKHEAVNRPLTLPQVKELFALSCGYTMALRHRGIGVGDAQYNDAAYGNAEVQRYAREVHNFDLKAWWHEVVK